MALRIWLPLTKDLNNYGLDRNLAITNNGVTITETGGKLGGYALLGTYKFYIPTLSWMQPNSELDFSICMWVNCTDSSLADTYFVACGSFEIFLREHGINFRIGNGGTNTCGVGETTGSYTVNTWYHVCGTWNHKTKQVKAYVNGVCKGSNTYSGTTYNDTESTIHYVYGGNYKMNDFRMYDHCLSDKEIQDISQGLILHYPLDKIDEIQINRINGNTLIWNQLADLGNTFLFYDTGHLALQDDGSLYNSITAAYTNTTFELETGHYYYFTITKKWNPGYENDVLYINNFTSGFKSYSHTAEDDTWYTITDVICPTENGTFKLGMGFGTSRTIYIKDVAICDLTLMFGAGNEPTTVAEFRKLFPKINYNYDKGSFLNYGGRAYNWNQQYVPGGSTATVDGITFTNNDNGTWTIDGTSTADYQSLIKIGEISTVIGHKYYTPMLSSNRLIDFGAYISAALIYGGVTTCNLSVTNNGYGIFIRKGTTVNNLTFRPYTIDLTQLFGKGLEPTTVEEVEHWLALNDITDFSYNSGEVRYYNYDCDFINLSDYITNKISLSIFKQCLPYGLCKVGDVYDLIALEENKTTILKNISSLNLENLTWNLYTSDDWNFGYASVSIPSSNIIASNGWTITTNDTDAKAAGNCFEWTGEYIRIVGDFSTLDEVKSAIKGVYFMYSGSPIQYTRILIPHKFQYSTNLYFTTNEIMATPTFSYLYNIFDDSGFNNNATNQFNKISVSSDTAKYENSVTNISDSSFEYLTCKNINIEDGPHTISFWYKPIDYDWNKDNSKFTIYFSNVYYFHYMNYPYYYHNGHLYYKYYNYWEDLNWHLVTLTYDGTNLLIYIDGETITPTREEDTDTTSTTYRNYLQLLLKYASVSDFRLYTTCLSAKDVKHLYNRAASIDNLGGIHCLEFKEDTSLSIKKNGEVLSESIKEHKNINIEEIKLSYTPSSIMNSTMAGYKVTYTDIPPGTVLTMEMDFTWSEKFTAADGYSLGCWFLGTGKTRNTETWSWGTDILCKAFTASKYPVNLITTDPGTYHYKVNVTTNSTCDGGYIGLRTDYSSGTGTLTLSNLKIYVADELLTRSQLAKFTDSYIMGTNLIEI